MSEVPSTPPPGPVSRVSLWWKVFLVGSLALNLLFIGGGIARYYFEEPPGRMTGISEMQLVPRKFFSDIAGERRRELAGVFRNFRGDFREGRADRRRVAAEIAAALEATPYDEAKLREAIAAFNESSAALINRGGEAALAFIAQLTPDERRLLARRILERVNRGPEPPQAEQP